MKNLLKRILRKNQIDDFSARKMFSISKYGRDEVTNEQLYNEWQKQVRDRIKFRSNNGRDFSVICNIPQDMENYVERLIGYLREKEFNVNLIAESTLKNYQGQDKYLLITWDKVDLG